MSKNAGRLVKLTLILLIGLVLLVLIPKLPVFFSKQAAFFPNLQKNQVSKLTLTDGKASTVVVKKNGRWFSADFPADEERIGPLISALIALKKDEVASQNRAKYKDFGVDGRRKLVFDGGFVYIGAAAGFNRTYVRVGQDPLVYAVNTDLISLVSPADFRDLATHFLIDEAKATKVSLAWEGRSLTLRKEKADWLIGGQKARKERVDFLLSDVKTLKGNDILKKDAVDLRPLPSELTLELTEDKQIRKARLYQKGATDYYFYQDGADFVYQIPAAYVASLKKEEKDLLE